MRNKYAPLVSIVIPCFNCERWIGDAIESALGQSYPNIEIIVVNDGSTDSSLGVINSFGGKVNCISRRNGGPSAAMNFGLRVARGEWIQFLGSDDLLHPDKISLSVRTCERHPEVEFVWAPNLSVPEGFSLRTIEAQIELEPEALLSLNALEATYAPSAAMLRSSFLRRVGEFDESLRRWVDLEYHARIAALIPTYARLSNPLYFYREHRGVRISNSNRDHSNIHEALESLRLTRATLEASTISPGIWKSCLWPFYLQLARSSAIAGDKKMFRGLIQDAAVLRGSLRFKLKCYIAVVSAQLLGLKLSTDAIEYALRFRNSRGRN
jgi:glycosyltransferase involved in cell wall biosynthesis